MADVILLVAQLELASLRNVVRLIHSLTGEENLADKVRVVINRQGADSVEEGISLKKAEEVIGKPIFWQVPNDTKSVIGARVAGHPLVKFAPERSTSSSFTLVRFVPNRFAPLSSTLTHSTRDRLISERSAPFHQARSTQSRKSRSFRLCALTASQ